MKLIFLMFFILYWSFQFINQDEKESYKDPRDGNEYQIIQLNGLNWFAENLRFRTKSNKDTLVDQEGCGVFYLENDARKVCPEAWRLPTKPEVKQLLKLDKKKKIDLNDTLNIILCGRIDYEKHTKAGHQNTFWLNESLENGHVTHWHTFTHENEIHSHDVVNARRKFPVRCVCEIEKIEN